MRFEQGFALIEVRDISSRKNETEGVSQSITGEVSLGGKAPLRAPHGMGQLSSHRASSMLMDP